MAAAWPAALALTRTAVGRCRRARSSHPPPAWPPTVTPPGGRAFKSSEGRLARRATLSEGRERAVQRRPTVRRAQLPWAEIGVGRRNAYAYRASPPSVSMSGHTVQSDVSWTATELIKVARRLIFATAVRISPLAGHEGESHHTQSDEAINYVKVSSK